MDTADCEALFATDAHSGSAVEYLEETVFALFLGLVLYRAFGQLLRVYFSVWPRGPHRSYCEAYVASRRTLHFELTLVLFATLTMYWAATDLSGASLLNTLRVGLLSMALTMFFLKCFWLLDPLDESRYGRTNRRWFLTVNVVTVAGMLLFCVVLLIQSGDSAAPGSCACMPNFCAVGTTTIEVVVASEFVVLAVVFLRFLAQYERQHDGHGRRARQVLELRVVSWIIALGLGLRLALYLYLPATCLVDAGGCSEKAYRFMRDVSFHLGTTLVPELVPLLAILYTQRERGDVDLGGKRGLFASTASSALLGPGGNAYDEEAGDGDYRPPPMLHAAAAALGRRLTSVVVHVRCSDMIVVDPNFGLELPCLFARKRVFLVLWRRAPVRSNASVGSTGGRSGSFSAAASAWFGLDISDDAEHDAVVEIGRTEIQTSATPEFVTAFELPASDLLADFEWTVDVHYRSDARSDRLAEHERVATVGFTSAEVLAALPRDAPGGGAPVQPGALRKRIRTFRRKSSVVKEPAMTLRLLPLIERPMPVLLPTGSAGLITQTYCVASRSGALLVAREELSESPWTFVVPTHFLQLRLSDLALETAYLQEDSPEHARALFKMRSLQSLVEAYSERLTMTFKSSAAKKDQTLSAVPTNLHVQLFRVHPLVADADGFVADFCHDTCTVGAPAAHALGFKFGGLRQIAAALQQREANGTADDAAAAELRQHLDAREDLVFSQALTVAVTVFVRKLERGLTTRPEELEQLAAIGLLMEVESLVSTHGKEMMMLGDMDYALQQLQRVGFRVVSAAQDDSLGTTGILFGSGIKVHLTGSVAGSASLGAGADGDEALETLLCPDNPITMMRENGMVVVQLRLGSLFVRLPQALRQGQLVTVTPVLFSQGINEMQSVADAVGDSSLQHAINSENLPRLARYVERYEEWRLLREMSSASSSAVSGPPPAVEEPRASGSSSDSPARPGLEMGRVSSCSASGELAVVVAAAAAEPEPEPAVEPETAEEKEEKEDEPAAVLGQRGISVVSERESGVDAGLSRAQRLIADAETAVQDAAAHHHKRDGVRLLQHMAELTRLAGGARVTVCKSAKDRTSMSVTLEQARLLCGEHEMDDSLFADVLDTMRTNGVRRENARKNIGKGLFAFNSLQRQMLPAEYRAPKEVSGARQS